jgi:hypothetical protein
VVFCAKDWTVFGHRCGLYCPHSDFVVFGLDSDAYARDFDAAYGQDLNADISTVTGIQLDYLTSPAKRTGASIAQKMSWAANRKTIRVEDEAYCLLGIFDTNMPLLYGERHKAFRRLQEELIRRSDDQSIFAWPNDKEHGLLAPDPSSFAACGSIRRNPAVKGSFLYSVTQRGVEFMGCPPIDVPSEPFVPASENRLGFYIIRLNYMLDPESEETASDEHTWCTEEGTNRMALVLGHDSSDRLCRSPDEIARPVIRDCWKIRQRGKQAAKQLWHQSLINGV